MGRAQIIRIGRFIVSGAFAAAVHVSLLYILVEYVRVWYLTATTIAFLFGFATSFILQKFWTFGHAAMEYLPREVVRYAAVGAGGLVGNGALMYILVGVSHMPYLLAQIVTAAVLAVATFFLYGRVVFVKAP